MFLIDQSLMIDGLKQNYLIESVVYIYIQSTGCHVVYSTAGFKMGFNHACWGMK